MSDGAATRRWLGATVDLHAVRRDAVLAGVFSGANAYAGTLQPVWFLLGSAFGAFIGMVLHVLPAEPQPGDDRTGRIVIRGFCGFIGGAGAGAAIAFIASGVAFGVGDPPMGADFLPHIAVGALTGGAWYVAWGFWETRGGGGDEDGVATESGPGSGVLVADGT
jgi:hypothetical protein